MNILFLTPQLPYPPRQGATIRNYNLIAELARRHTIDLLSFLAPGESLAPDNPLHTICRRVAVTPQPLRSSRQRMRDTLLSGLPDMALRLESRAMRNLVATWAGDAAYDIVQVEGIELAQYGMQIAGRTSGHTGGDRPALVFDDHNCEYLLQQRSAFTDLGRISRLPAAAYSLVQWQKLRRYEAAILRAADATVAVSAADKAALQTLVPATRIVVVSNGIDLDVYQPSSVMPATAAPKLVLTGKMDYRPNIDAALWFGREVLPLIVQHEPAVRFQIVGLNPHPRLDELRNQPNIEITGAVDDTRPYIQGAAVYVIPMRVGGGTRFKALEAMACAKAIVSTPLGVEGIQVQDGQEMLIRESAAQFAAGVLDLIADLRRGADLQQRLGAAGRRFVELHYSWRAIVPALEHVYTNLLRSPNTLPA
jgi:polysaccharide biosynthesis protein PslH